MARTSVNVLGNCLASVVVARWEGEFDDAKAQANFGDAAVKTAVINKRAGGQGLISGRKSFQRPMADGIALLNAIQDVYLDSTITVA